MEAVRWPSGGVGKLNQKVDLMTTMTREIESVKPVIDLKGPLKGKGGSLAQWQRDTEARLKEVYDEMTLLSEESKSIEGRKFGLYVYALRDAQQLRWRMTSSRHATWAKVEPMLGSMPPGLAQWYRKAEEVAQILNHREQVLRYELKTVCRLMSGVARIPRGYNTTVGRGAGGGRPTELGATERGARGARKEDA